jgi:hypothetical protein
MWCKAHTCWDCDYLFSVLYKFIGDVAKVTITLGGHNTWQRNLLNMNETKKKSEYTIILF